VRAVGKSGLLVQAADGVVQVSELQPEGKRPMAGKDFANGYRVKEGDRFAGE
jgi:methionyl-tRNA formyltransferase